MTPITARNDLVSGASDRHGLYQRFMDYLDDSAPIVLLAPAMLFVLFLAIFPLIVSLVLSLTRVDLVRQTVKYVGLANFEKLLFGSEQRRVLGSRFNSPSLVAWILGGAVFIIIVLWLISYIRRPGRSIAGTGVRLFAVIFSGALIWLSMITLSGNGLPGSLIVTLVFVAGGVTAQYLLGLGLAMLLTQALPGRRFFRIIFLLPMLMTPVGVGFLFRMLADTTVGPLSPMWAALGLTNFSWAENGASARFAILIGDVWQWTPFMFIILLAALEGTSRDQLEAAMVDGASKAQSFRYIVIPQILPVSLTVIFIRMIEAFKIIDLPNIMTGGAPGGATETLTLFAFIKWRAPELGSSAAVAYILLIVVTFISIMYANVIRGQALKSL